MTVKMTTSTQTGVDDTSQGCFIAMLSGLKYSDIFSMHHQQGLHTNQHFPAQTFYEKGDQKPLCT
jgi:hypothetical protein